MSQASCLLKSGISCHDFAYCGKSQIHEVYDQKCMTTPGIIAKLARRSQNKQSRMTYLLSASTLSLLQLHFTKETIQCLLKQPDTAIVLLVPKDLIVHPIVLNFQRLPKSGSSCLQVLPYDVESVKHDEDATNCITKFCKVKSIDGFMSFDEDGESRLRLAAMDALNENEDLKNQLETVQQQARKYYDHMIKAQTDATKYQNETAKAQEAKRNLETSLDCDRFILVLIDGDSMPFLDDLVVRGVEGGLDAGRRLRNGIQEYIRTLPTYHADDRIVIHIYANMRGLSKACRQANIIREEERMSEFVAGLGASHPLTSFTDAGGVKEAADAKMRAQMELFYRNIHCKHIIFGGADNGYAGFLNTFANVSGINDRITFLDGPLTPHHLQRMINYFKSTQFRELFRPTKIVTHGGTIGTKRSAPDSIDLPQRRPSSPRPQHYSRNSPGFRPSHSGPLPLPRVAQETVYPAPPVIYQNKYGQRLDPPVNVDKDFLNVLFTTKAKLCNNFYLKGHCSYGDNCSWDHSERLSPIELDTLRHKARTSACRDPFCRDPECSLGHMCQRGDRCDISRCKFLPEMHSIDTSQVFEFNPVTYARELVHEGG